MSETIKKTKKRRKPMAWFKRYFRILLGATLIGIMLLFVLLGPIICPYEADEIDTSNRYASPSAEHWFGTDQYGRDYFERLAVGGVPTILIALVSQLCICVLGIVLGLLSGYYRPFDNVCSRIMETIHMIPSFLTVILVASLIGKGYVSVIIALTLGGIVGITRTMRGEVLRLRSLEFIEAEKAMGANAPRTIFMHILPQTMNYLLIRFGTGIANLVLTTASLSYLGIGLPTNIPNWGAMISEGQAQMLVHPYLVISPGVCIVIVVFGFSLLGEGLRDVLDPKYR